MSAVSLKLSLKKCINMKSVEERISIIEILSLFRQIAGCLPEQQ
ncbi:hypothetical protein EZMO1_0289 [Endozoicomonas montiporae CL-33]|uniref:Uncharacterized protein n=1 Tax=Endozoicomonas montiporae CL-33 TaxID=570277 RepID=A0A142B727_9GAMM|nr:hypothetical protein EZMO1_0289 [Endozoicomonas montiporae CL-33]